MAKRDEEPLGVGTWFLQKLLTSPAGLIGLLAGTFVGIAMFRAGSLSGGIGLGCMVGFAAGMTSLAIQKLVQQAHRQSLGTETGGSSTLLQDLGENGLEAEAEFLERLLQDEEEIREICTDSEEIPNAERTLALVSQVRAAAVGGAEELLELVRQARDTVLDPPADLRPRDRGAAEGSRRGVPCCRRGPSPGRTREPARPGRPPR